MIDDDIGAVEQRLGSAATWAAERRALGVLVMTADLVAILREFAALRKSYDQRGEAIERIGAGGAK